MAVFLDDLEVRVDSKQFEGRVYHRVFAPVGEHWWNFVDIEGPLLSTGSGVCPLARTCISIFHKGSAGSASRIIMGT